MNALYLYALALLLAFSGYAQSVVKSHTKQDGSPTFLRFNETQKLYNAADQLQALRDNLPVQKGDEFLFQKEEKDEIGFTHATYAQYYQGVEVRYSAYRVHMKGGQIVTMSGKFSSTEGIGDVDPMIAASDAESTAKAAIPSENYYPEMDDTKLVILPADITGTKFAVLAYEVDVYSMSPLNRQHVYVDAKSGKIVKMINRIHNAEDAQAATRFSGQRTMQTTFNGQANGYMLDDDSRGNGIETVIDGGPNLLDLDNNWTAQEYDNSEKDNGVIDAHWGAQKTYDYFFEKFNRNSIDNNGLKLKQNAHVGQNYVNAYWDGAQMYYGDGDNQISDILTSLDVVAHEIGHGFCQYAVAGGMLIYQKEPGALNESLSDIWAACIEDYFAPEKDIWIMGEDMWIGEEFPYIRSMSNPKLAEFPPQPDTYNGEYYVSTNGCFPADQNDWCGVHTNSGVVNYWFYLISEGGEGINDKDIGYNVNGFGIDKAAAIVYRTETQYLNSTSDFTEMMNFSLQSAEELYGVNSPEVQAVDDAWIAVGLKDPVVPNYCAANGQNANLNEAVWISRVALGGGDNTPDNLRSLTQYNGGYGDFTDVEEYTMKVQRGGGYELQITPGAELNWQNWYFKAWVDFNQDGSFDDANEQVYATANPEGEVEGFGMVNIPNNAPYGSTRMRIAVGKGSAPNECGQMSFGEVEDYTLVITEDGFGVPPDQNLWNPIVYPNPGTYFNVANYGEYAVGKVYNRSGLVQVVELNDMNSNINLEGYPNGLYYLDLVVDGERFSYKLVVE